MEDDSDAMVHKYQGPTAAVHIKTGSSDDEDDDEEETEDAGEQTEHLPPKTRQLLQMQDMRRLTESSVDHTGMTPDPNRHPGCLSEVSDSDAKTPGVRFGRAFKFGSGKSVRNKKLPKYPTMRRVSEASMTSAAAASASALAAPAVVFDPSEFQDDFNADSAAIHMHPIFLLPSPNQTPRLESNHDWAGALGPSMEVFDDVIRHKWAKHRCKCIVCFCVVLALGAMASLIALRRILFD
jgi:hypothetical protein